MCIDCVINGWFVFIDLHLYLSLYLCMFCVAFTADMPVVVVNAVTRLTLADLVIHYAQK